MMERREYTRIVTTLAAELRFTDGRVYGGIVRDLSFGGVYLDCDQAIDVPSEKMPLEEESVLVMTVQDKNGEVSAIEVRCQLVGTDGHRAGLRLVGMEPEHYQKFRDFLLEHTDDPEKLLREISRYPKNGFPREPTAPGFMDWLRWVLNK